MNPSGFYVDPMKCDVIYRCVSFIIDYQYFSEAVCKLCAMNFCVQRKKPLQISL